MNIYAAYEEYDAYSKWGRSYVSNGKKKEYQGFYKEEINCLRDCVENSWQCEVIELEDTKTINFRDDTPGILTRDMRFA